MTLLLDLHLGVEWALIILGFELPCVVDNGLRVSNRKSTEPIKPLANDLLSLTCIICCSIFQLKQLSSLALSSHCSRLYLKNLGSTLFRTSLFVLWISFEDLRWYRDSGLLKFDDWFDSYCRETSNWGSLEQKKSWICFLPLIEVIFFLCLANLAISAVR